MSSQAPAPEVALDIRRIVSGRPKAGQAYAGQTLESQPSNKEPYVACVRCGGKSNGYDFFRGLSVKKHCQIGAHHKLHVIKTRDSAVAQAPARLGLAFMSPSCARTYPASSERVTQSYANSARPGLRQPPSSLSPQLSAEVGLETQREKAVSACKYLCLLSPELSAEVCLDMQSWRTPQSRECLQALRLSSPLLSRKVCLETQLAHCRKAVSACKHLCLSSPQLSAEVCLERRTAAKP